MKIFRLVLLVAILGVVAFQWNIDREKRQLEAFAQRKKHDAELIKAIQALEDEGNFKKLVRDHKINVGMTEQMVNDAWGSPDRKHNTVNEHSTSSQWVYNSGAYLYFENGILTSWQTPE